MKVPSFSATPTHHGHSGSLLIMLTLAASLLLSGCTSRSADDIPDYNHLIHYETASLEGRLRISQVTTDTVGDVLRAQVTLENPSAFTARYQYKFRWFDANGMEIALEGEPWKPQELAARNEARVQGVAPNPAVVRFELRVRN